jgi:hypothetical protein
MFRAHVLLLLAGVLCADTASAQSTKPRLLRVQPVGDTTYFHVRFDVPGDMLSHVIKAGPYAEAERRRLALTPALVPQDDQASAVYQRLGLAHFRPDVRFYEPAPGPRVEGLEFTGKLNGKGKAKFRLLYPTTSREKAPAGIQDKELATLLRAMKWREIPVELDFAKAEKLPAPVREKGDDAEVDDLEKLWAAAQASRLAILEAQAPQSGFFGFASAATGRKYGVPDPVLEGERHKTEEHVHRRMLDLTTGTKAITESLALKRLKGSRRTAFDRDIDIATVQGITIAEHPWVKMMAGHKPAPEPLADLVPHDNYYIRFKTFAKFAEFGDFLDQWGTPASRAYEAQSRDYALKERYERQLCLKSTSLGRTLGPFLIRSIAVTGNDPYIREGSDVTVIFHTNNRDLFLAGVEPFLQEARKEHGPRLAEKKDTYKKITIESFVTPLREVSVHRAAFGDFVVYSNSPVGVRRIIDTRERKELALSASLDFQYMRTVFRADDKEEDGFAFLSDAFIRQLVGPASKIKEMRRLEALTSLSMLTNGALFTAWETGKLPADQDALMKAAHLRPEYLYVPEGKPVRWDAERNVAVSDVYNTIHFATPLIELPIDKITRLEEDTYTEFRREYQQLWRQFFDPVGIRFALKKEQVKVEVYVLPMVNNAEYNRLRELTGRGVAKLDPATISSRSLLQFTMNFQLGWLFESLGNWAMVRLDDQSSVARLGEWWIRQDLTPKDEEQRNAEIAALVLKLPLTAGVGIRDHKGFKALRALIIQHLKNDAGPVKITESKYQNTTITRFEFSEDSRLIEELNRHAKTQIKKLVVYETIIGDAWYAGFDKSAIKDLIDRAEARKKNPMKADTVDINASWHMSPKAAEQAGAALKQYLEWETHKRALPNDALWYILYRARVIDAKMSEPERQRRALTFLGFIPVSPDDAPYRFDAAKDEVVNQRHGSLRSPTLHSGIAETSPLNGILAQFPALRVDLRFREDGFHSVITLKRK